MFKLVVLSLVLATAAAKPSVLGLGLAGLPLGGHLGIAGPLGLGLAGPLAAAHIADPLGAAHLAAPLAAAPLASIHGGAPTAVVAAPLHGAGVNYRGPVSLAPGQPANIVATDGRPLDTLSVNVDRALHYTARAVDGAHAHLLGKRSAPLVGAWGHGAILPAAHGLGVAPLGIHGAPLALRAPIAPLGVGHLGIGHLGLGHAGLAHW